uniref:Uncharacterized protein n=1 Tax=Rhizophora mucronata TaxID=61149 RepID=A0A2P2KM06_RHIMU
MVTNCLEQVRSTELGNPTSCSNHSTVKHIQKLNCPFHHYLRMNGGEQPLQQLLLLSVSVMLWIPWISRRKCSNFFFFLYIRKQICQSKFSVA